MIVHSTINEHLSRYLLKLSLYISVLQIFKDVAGVDTVSRAWKCANPREIENNWISLYDLNFNGAGAEWGGGGGGGEVLCP